MKRLPPWTVWHDTFRPIGKTMIAVFQLVLPPTALNSGEIFLQWILPLHLGMCKVSETTEKTCQKECFNQFHCTKLLFLSQISNKIIIFARKK